MSKAVAAEVLTAEPPCHHDNLVPQTLSFEHSKNDHAGPASPSSFSII
jgi:hypothetical protein